MSNSSQHANSDGRQIRHSPFAIRNSIDVSAGLVFRAGQLLITQRPAGGHLAGLWEFPGGKREPSESFEECLRRELQEELGVAVHVHDELERLTHTYPEKTVHLRFFRCTLVDEQAEPRALACQAVGWVTRETLAKYRFPAADARLLEMLKAANAWWQTG